MMGKLNISERNLIQIRFAGLWLRSTTETISPKDMTCLQGAGSTMRLGGIELQGFEEEEKEMHK